MNAYPDYSHHRRQGVAFTNHPHDHRSRPSSLTPGAGGTDDPAKAAHTGAFDEDALLAQTLALVLYAPPVILTGGLAMEKCFLQPVAMRIILMYTASVLASVAAVFFAGMQMTMELKGGSKAHESDGIDQPV